ncbi:DEAD/DEAH box helicase family protein [Chitinophaga varians]|uniref:DEAD/DEAH box helicase family protein n=1 Tax=Chitinophaga varians TaxID=2202339 RepID=A0A847S636_9BACT|nr:TnsA endonuclease N-terminal domain-containing protein [Chitinophaga varians]NLR68538.1 DEAD/DEAH box helicase family protein [Chitinophaga varians]
MVKQQQNEIEFPFYVYLRAFYNQERKKILTSYNTLTRKFISFNDPDNKTSFLRRPQFEALEIYVFLKEFCENKHLHEIFQEWFDKSGKFNNRSDTGISSSGQTSLFGPVETKDSDEKKAFKAVFEQIKKFEQIYPNFIFALTMGLGKTVLMATSIFYEFLLANKYPKSERYCHNALVFAPDKTVLQSLKEIQVFDKSKVVPPEYINWLEANLKFYFLDESGDALNTIENSKYNVIISNSQKIILKKQHKTKSASQLLFEDFNTSYKAKSLNKDFEDLYGFEIDTDQDLITNQRFAKLTKLKQLGIYVDEAHHVFGNQLAIDFGLKKSSTSLRVTINELAENLKEAGTRVVGCYNYTGTPYVGSRLLPEVVYAYGLKEAINNRYLKKVNISGFTNVKTQAKAFVRTAIVEFWSSYNRKRYEGCLPKIAFFASSIEELDKELRPAVEDVLSELGIPLSSILVNVGDAKLTSNDDLREFKNLDTPTSEKQFILLVNKGKEGWNCRSLFGVALNREPKSKIFVLQAAMRCLRQIGDVQETGMVFLSDENVRILNEELEENFKLSVDDLNEAGDNSEIMEVRLVPPPVKVKLKRINKLHQLVPKKIGGSVDLELASFDTEKYKIFRSQRNITDLSKKIGQEVDFSHIKDKRQYSEIMLIAEISRYLNESPIRIRELLVDSVDGLDQVIAKVNEFNEVLHDWIIPRLFGTLYTIKEYTDEEDMEIELIKEPKDGDCYKVKARQELIASLDSERYAPFAERSFHVDKYCFDSNPESKMFWTLLQDERIEKVWFTGMFTHGQSDFVVNYIDPESHTVRSYYPDFLLKLKEEAGDGYVILEVKGDNKIEDAVVKAKSEYATQIAGASGMVYKIIKASDASAGIRLKY